MLRAFRTYNFGLFAHTHFRRVQKAFASVTTNWRHFGWILAATGGMRFIQRTEARAKAERMILAEQCARNRDKADEFRTT
ncbi:hypothetical protein K438DRAFT_664142 [Mycena galopus ATCC 62051]|nr:hypothetical protein K438DRAFT_664142 [Mycena galopus ATCC 62051]